MSKKFRRCCKEELKNKDTGITEEDKNLLDQEVHVSENIKPGMNHELLNGFGGHKEIFKAISNISSNGSVHRIKVKYKPVEITAYYIQSDDKSGERKTGWLIPGPGRAVFYVPEDAFSETFEFIEDEGRIIA